MTHKSDSNSLRLKYSRLWTHVWSNNLEYNKLFIEDIRISLLIKQFYKPLVINILHIRIKRATNYLFINLIGLVKTREYVLDDSNFKDMNYHIFLISFEFRKLIRSVCGYTNVMILYRIIHFGFFKKKQSLFNIISLKSSKVFCNYLIRLFKRKFRKPKRPILGMLRALIRKKYQLYKMKIFGFKVILKGPLYAPRGRRKKVFKKAYGKVPLNSFHCYVDFYQTTGNTKNGSFGLKVWIYRGYRSLIFSGSHPLKTYFNNLKKIRYDFYTEEGDKLDKYFYLPLSEII